MNVVDWLVAAMVVGAAIVAAAAWPRQRHGVPPVSHRAMRQLSEQDDDDGTR